MYDLSKDRILVVDDEPDNLELLKATLEMLYFATVETVLGGEEALISLRDFRPTVIVTDLSMPKMYGYALLHRLRQDGEAAFLPVIALTAHAMDGDCERILAAGFNGYLSKPFDVTILGDNIIACLELYQAQRVAPETTASALPSGTVSGNKRDEDSNAIQ